MKHLYIKLTDSITSDEYYFTRVEAIDHLRRQLIFLDENIAEDLHYIITPVFLSREEFELRKLNNQ